MVSRFGPVKTQIKSILKKHLQTCPISHMVNRHMDER